MLEVEGTCFSVRDTPYSMWKRVKELTQLVRQNRETISWHIEMKKLGIPWIMFHLSNIGTLTLKVCIKPKDELGGRPKLRRSLSLPALLPAWSSNFSTKRRSRYMNSQNQNPYQNMVIGDGYNQWSALENYYNGNVNAEMDME